MFFYPSTNDISNGACELPYEIIFTMGKVGKWWVIFNTRLTLFSAPCVNRVNFLRNKKARNVFIVAGCKSCKKKANSKNKYAYLYLHKRSRGLLSNPAKIKAFRVESLCLKEVPDQGLEP